MESGACIFWRELFEGASVGLQGFGRRNLIVRQQRAGGNAQQKQAHYDHHGGPRPRSGGHVQDCSTRFVKIDLACALQKVHEQTNDSRLQARMCIVPLALPYNVMAFTSFLGDYTGVPSWVFVRNVLYNTFCVVCTSTGSSGQPHLLGRAEFLSQVSYQSPESHSLSFEKLIRATRSRRGLRQE